VLRSCTHPDLANALSPPGLTKCATSALASTPSKPSPAVWLGPPTDRVVGKQERASSHLNANAAVGR